jgi:hypothetical protein
MPPITFLEVTFDAGRRAVREALELNWQAGKPAPLEYRLLNPLIWNTKLDPEAGLAQIPADRARTQDDAIKVCEHPAFASWFWQDAALVEAALGLGKQPSAEERDASVTRLANSRFTPEVVACQPVSDPWALDGAGTNPKRRRTWAVAGRWPR